MSDSFDDYIFKVLNYIRNQFHGEVMRVDIVFEVLRNDSLKAATREKRGKGTHRHVEGRNKVPSNWQDFFRNDDSKADLFHRIAECIANVQFPGTVIATYDNKIVSSVTCDLTELMDCTHEEADTRMFVHASHGARHGLQRILIRTVDTDVVVIGISLARKITCENLWMAFGSGSALRYLDVTLMAQILGPEKCGALPAFHAFSGGDVTS